MRSKLLCWAVAFAAGSCFPSARAVQSVDFSLVSVGVSDRVQKVPYDLNDAELPSRLSGTEFGRAVLLTPEYFAGSMGCISQLLSFRVDGGSAERLVSIRFSDPGRSESTNVTALGTRKIKTEQSMTMNALVTDRAGVVLFSRNFEQTLVREFAPAERPVGECNPCDKLVRKCLSDLAMALKEEFTVRIRISVRLPEGCDEFNAETVAVRIDGTAVDHTADIRIRKGDHIVDVTADGCVSVSQPIKAKENSLLSFKLKRK